MTEQTDIQAQIDARAAAWLISRAEGQISPPKENAFQAWRRADHRHDLAYEAALYAWEKAQYLAKDPQVRKVAHLPGVRLSLGMKRHCMHLGFALAASLVMFICVGFVLKNDALTHAYSTSPGQIKTIALMDGTEVILDGNSRLDVAFTSKTRLVHLRSGGAYFTAAPLSANEVRPLVVEAKGGTTRALGTQFCVEYLDDEIRVSVAQHSVEVRQGGDLSLLTAGEQVQYDEVAVGQKGLQAMHDVASWRDGQMVFNKARLVDVIAQINRYSPQTVHVLRTEARGRIVSGIFKVDAPEAAIETIAQTMALRKLYTPAGIFLY